MWSSNVGAVVKVLEAVFSKMSHASLCDYSEQTIHVQSDPKPDVCDPMLWYIHGNSYDLSSYVRKHPGGELAILSARGRDCTAIFESYHPWNDNSRKVLQAYGAKPPPCEPIYEDMKKGLRQLYPKGAKETKMRPTTIAALVAIQTFVMYLFFVTKTWSSCLLAGVLASLFSARLTHEPGHFQASTKPWVNRLLTWYGYFLLAPSLCWYYRHVISHHPHTNDPHHDVDVAALPVLDVLPPQLKWLKVLSVPVLFTSTPFFIGLGTLFDMFAFRSVGNNYTCLTIGGLIYETILWFIVHYFFGPSIWCYLCMACTSGTIFVIFSQIGHAIVYPAPSSAVSWTEQQMRSSINFAPRSSFWYHVAFGLTTQIDHHLFPGVGAHCLDDIHDKVVKPICAKHSIPVYDLPAKKALSFLWQRFLTGKPVKIE